ncbi:MAG: pyridoxal phosphate-dependent aminotransferase [Kiloniellales bacterium]
MRTFEQRNQHFDRLVANPALRWMGQNSNHYAQHPAVRDAMVESISREEYHVYAPPVGLEELRALVLRDFGLPDVAALITDGAVAGLYHIVHSLCRAGDQFLTTDPSWTWPMAVADSLGVEVVQLPIYGDDYGFRLDPQRLQEAVTGKTKLIYLVDPNNPLGTSCSAEEIAAIAEVAREAGAYLVQDCSYRDFAYRHHLAAQHYVERSVTVWSFSQWLGFAGLRLGAVIGHPDLIERLAAAPPNMLGSNIVAQRGAIAGLKVKQEWFPAVLEGQRANQELIRQVVTGMPGLRLPVFPSNGNFLVLDCHAAKVSPEALCAALARHDILVRQGAYHSAHFGDRFIRISTAVPPEWIDAFCQQLPRALDEARGMTEQIELF